MSSSSSSSEEEFDDAPISKLATKKLPAHSNGVTKPPTITSSSSNDNKDDDDGDFEPKPKKKKSAKNGTTSKKRKATRNDSEAEVEEEGDDDAFVRQKKKPKNGKSKKNKKESAKSAANARKDPPPKKLKKLEKADRIAHAMQSFLWWDAPSPPEGCQWSTMEHAGVSFTEPYEPHGVKLKYDGKEVDLSPVEEEAATLFASMDPEGMHLGNPRTATIFIKNFFKDFTKVIDKKHGIKKFEKCDFGPIRKHLDEQKLVKKAVSDEQRKMNKEERNQAMFKFGYAIVDGHIEKVGNYNMEPPAAFRGRGEHPKMGKLKHRVDPEQVSLNVSECARVPPCGVPGHAWGELRHDPQVQWLTKWEENINNQVKYVQLAAQSSFKGKSDRSKYNKAAQLCGNIDKIRASYKEKLISKSSEDRQLATAMWVIDRLALRVGGEKDTDAEADTVGCCSLRVEHLHFNPNDTDDDNKEIELEFLGKDSMLFKQTIDFGSELYTENNGMGEQVYKNLKNFCKKKEPSNEVFDSLTPTVLNTHLKGIMEGLTAKVFRTYNASKTLQDELRKTEQASHWGKLTAAEKVVEYNNANRQVAILCNHQKSVSKAQETQLESIGDKIATLKKQRNTLKKILKVLNEGDTKKMAKIPTKDDETKAKENVDKAVAKAKKMKDEAKTDEQKIAATAHDQKTKQMKRDLTNMKFEQAHLWDRMPKKDQVSKKITNWAQKISKMEMNLKHRDDNKEVSLGTSKINYMDPRITVAWCKRNEVPIEKVFSKTLRDKFNWAAAVPPTWEFNAEVAKQG